MPKGQYIRTSEIKLKNSSSLKGNIPWNKGNKKEKPILSEEELQVKASLRTDKLKARAIKTAQTKRNQVIQQYLNLADDVKWSNAVFSTNDKNIGYLQLTHVPCGTTIKVQTQTIRKHSADDSLCKICNPVFRGSSGAEGEVYAFIQEHRPDAKRHFDMPSKLELDIIISDLKLAIEYDGLYWHSEKAGYPPGRHLQKTKEAASLGLKLIQIFEDEWLYKRELVQSRLKIALGIQNIRLYARKLIVKEISNIEAENFLNENHLQGNTNSKIKLGLFNGGELVSVMTFGKPRFNKKFDWELIRFATKQNMQVIGGASKLLAAFQNIEKTGKLISYADRRWSDGKLYEALGFTLIGESTPSYWYFKGTLEKIDRLFKKQS